MHAATRALAGTVLAGQCLLAAAADLTVGAGGTYPRLADAIAHAQDGDTVLVAPGTYAGDVAVITQRKLTIRGQGQRPVLRADGQHAEGKAILVVRDGEVLIENLEFRGARVPDINGAGIRFERGTLMVRDCSFIDNENGILTGNHGDARLRIEDSLFAQAPDRPDSLDHLVYVGRIAEVTIIGSRFHQGRTGHLIKSRAKISRITYNLIADGPLGQASYEIDLPQGGLAVLIGNVIAQGAHSQNPVVVAYGAEGPAWPVSGLYMAHNTLVNERLGGAWFLRVWRDKLPANTPVHLVNNLSVGLGVFIWGIGDAATTQVANFASVINPLTGPGNLPYLLPPDSWLRGRGVRPGAPDGIDLRPTAEFTWPIGSRPLATPPNWSPGAFQR
ncbi:MAG: hypothetical protein CFE45_42920 [Burkholderiales bacterium PBB5]|nr:MAG: hypothetical protein CFE45_42920 [Burkholderiales bacterium PBB5]